MSDARDPTPEQHDRPQPSAADQVSIDRRRALLRGLGKGAAIAGAAVPLNSLAGAKEMMRLTKANGQAAICTPSGAMSVMSSIAHQHPECSGKSPAWYKSTNGVYVNWPKNGKNAPVCKFGSIDRYPRDTFYTCFGSGPSDPTTGQIGYLLNNPGGANDTYAYWVAAVLNANCVATFPYSSAEVVALYKGSTQTAALTFFKTYLSS